MAERNSSRTERSQQSPKKGHHYSNPPEIEKCSNSLSDIVPMTAETHDDLLWLMSEQCTHSEVQQIRKYSRYREIQPSYHNL